MQSSTIYDVGGFNGIFGLLAAKVNPAARIVIFEPDSVSARHIKENIKLNGLSNCEIRAVAVSDMNGTARFSQGGSTGERLSEHGSEVHVESLDSMAPANLIKIDVEGAETKVIAGGLSALAKTKPAILLEVHPWIDKAEEVRMWSSLKALGYSWAKVGGDEEGNPHYLVS